MDNLYFLGYKILPNSIMIKVVDMNKFVVITVFAGKNEVNHETLMNINKFEDVSKYFYVSSDYEGNLRLVFKTEHSDNPQEDLPF